MKNTIYFILFMGLFSCKGSYVDNSVFPYSVTDATASKKNLSKAIKRSFNSYMAYRPEDNPLYTTFKYTKLNGFDYRNGDGTVSRRDPSKIIKVNNTYYVWYTKRDTKCPPIGSQNASKCDDETPSTDWDLAEIWYATSKDGLNWKEQGVAVTRPKKPIVGFRSLCTPDILVWKNRYYLYYQSFNEPSGLKGDYCPVSMAYAESPDGPWTKSNKEILPNGKKGEWDEFAVHDPYPLVHNGEIYIYYKSAFNRPDKLWVAGGLATAKNPKGPFVKCPQNPVTNSGHEIIMFPFKEGVAAILTNDGNEHNTIQYAKDWKNFDIASVVNLPPVAAGPYVEDAFTDTKNGKGISWGFCHFTGMGQRGKGYSILYRFDCSLTQSNPDSYFKTTRADILRPEVFMEKKLNDNILKKRIKENTLK